MEYWAISNKRWTSNEHWILFNFIYCCFFPFGLDTPNLVSARARFGIRFYLYYFCLLLLLLLRFFIRCSISKLLMWIMHFIVKGLLGRAVVTSKYFRREWTPIKNQPHKQRQNSEDNNWRKKYNNKRKS